MKIAVQIGHVNGKGGAAYEVETLWYIYPHVVERLRSAGYEVGEFDASIEREPGNYQYQYDGAVFLHCDAGSPARTGYSIGFWNEKHPGSRALAAVLKQVYGQASRLPFIGYNITIGEHHYYGNRRFYHPCKCTLLECGFVSNPSERAFLQASGKMLGYAIADAYIQFFGGQPQPEEDEMGFAATPIKMSPGDQFRYPAWLSHANGQVLWLDITSDSAESRFRFQARRDNGHWIGQAHTDSIEGESITKRWEIGEFFNVKEIGGLTLKMECLEGEITVKFAESSR